MESDGLYFLSGELEGWVLACPLEPLPPPRESPAEDGELFEGETLPEAALQTIRSWLGF
jgi:hypothetical protein